MSTLRTITTSERGATIIDYGLMERVVTMIQARDYSRVPCWPTEESPEVYNPTRLWGKRMLWMDERIALGQEFPKAEIAWQMGVQRELVRRALAHDPVNYMIRGVEFYERHHQVILRENRRLQRVRKGDPTLPLRKLSGEGEKDERQMG